MNEFQTIKADDFNNSPFRIIGKEWMLITAEKDGKANSMTASWGGFGVMWNRNAAFIVVRNSRYTKEFIDGSDHFSLSFFDREKYAKMLSYMGSVSGRAADKAAVCGLTLAHHGVIPFYSEAHTVLFCRKMFRQPIRPESFLEDGIDGTWYKDKDYHDLYIADIEEILAR